MPGKVKREAQLIFMCLQKKLNKGGKKDEGENGSLRRKQRESGEVNKETLRSVLMISAESKEKKRLLKESYINFRKLHKHLCDERKLTLFVFSSGRERRRQGKE